MDKKNYTIKDIARMAGVSAGTVDRVMHNRGEVSEATLKKVQKVLKEIDYHPNMFAIGLAAKKRYQIACLIPAHQEGDYWHSVAQGIEKAAIELRPFNVSVEFIYYVHAHESSYIKGCDALRNMEIDAALIAPNFEKETTELAAVLQTRKVPYIFVDLNIEGARALKYIGQDSHMSGYIAAKLLMQSYREGQKLVLFLVNGKDNPAEIQMIRRMEGFMQYINESFPQVRVLEFVLNKDNTTTDYEALENFFKNHPDAELGIVFNSRVYQVGNFLRESGRKMEALIGYDLLDKNTDLMKAGYVKYLIGQRPGLQGYRGIRALCEYVVFKQNVLSARFMPIDILMKENIDYYFEFD